METPSSFISYQLCYGLIAVEDKESGPITLFYTNNYAKKFREWDCSVINLVELAFLPKMGLAEIFQFIAFMWWHSARAW